MAMQITIRDVPEEVRSELAARAARQGKSMQEYLRAELVRLAARPAADDWVAAARERKAVSAARIPGRLILAHRDADRR